MMRRCARCAGARISCTTLPQPGLFVLQPVAPSGPAATRAAAGDWRVVFLASCAPGDIIAKLVGQGEWNAALKLAKDHGLPADDVYKCAPLFVTG
jgi:hypothetical protein